MNNFLRVLSIRSFLFLWLAEIFSQIAMNMVNFTLIIVAYKLAHSNTAVSGVVLSFTIPAILFGVLAGVFVDRWNKKTVLFFTNVLRTFFLVLLAFLHTNLFALYFLSFAMSVVTQFFIPAETPIIPLVVKNELLLSANALFGMGIYGSVFIAYGLSGPFLLLFGERYVFLILALSYILAAGFISFIVLPKHHKEKLLKRKSVRTSLGDELRGAIHIMAKTKDIYHSLLLLTLSQLIILILAVVGPGYAIQILGVQVDQFPLLFVTPASLGMVIGAVIIANVFHSYSKQKITTLGVFLAGVSMLLLPYGSKVASRDIVQVINSYLPHIFSITILHIMVVLAFLLGIASAFIFVPSNTILQEKTSDELRGKVYGTLNALIGLFSLFPIIIVGALADAFGVGRVITSIAVVIISIAVLRIVVRGK